MTVKYTPNDDYLQASYPNFNPMPMDPNEKIIEMIVVGTLNVFES